MLVIHGSGVKLYPGLTQAGINCKHGRSFAREVLTLELMLVRT